MSTSHAIIGGKLMEQFTTNGIQGYRESSIALPTFTTPPPARWTGSKIPLPLWRSVLAFFKWSYDTTKSEVQVRLLYNHATGEWKAHAFPQKRNTGMTTQELEDHPNRIEDMKLFPGFDTWGTVHHHCAMNAFQSGTDSNDERNQPGIHITIGNMDKLEHDIHSRVVVVIPGELSADGNTLVRAARPMQFEANLTDWFALPPELDAALPDALRPVVLKHYLVSQATAAETFPQRWQDNVIAVATTVQTNMHHTIGHYAGYASGWPANNEVHRQVHPAARHVAREDELLSNWDSYFNADATY